MEPQLSLLLYRKFSPLCKKLFGIVQSYNIDFSNLSLQMLCVDNEHIRKRIQSDKQINITSVPSILIIFPDGGIEKYEGEKVFEWIEQSILRLPQINIQQNHNKPLQSERDYEEPERKRDMMQESKRIKEPESQSATSRKPGGEGPQDNRIGNPSKSYTKPQKS